MHVACFVAAVFFSLLSVYWAVTSFQSKTVETGVYRILSESFTRSGSGTGFKVADPGYIVTNEHVVDKGRISVVTRKDNEKRIMPAEVIWISSDKDLAVLKTKEKLSDRNVLLADIDRAAPTKTSDVTAVGFPGISDELANELTTRPLDEVTRIDTYLDPTVSRGTVQRLVPTAKRLLVQHSANINKGNSGGPLFDACQRVIGVNTLSTISSFSPQDLEIAKRKGIPVKVENPGDLEFSVHVREVISALEDRNIRYASLSGSCHGGLDQSEMMGLGICILLALGSAFAGIYYMRQQYAPLPVPSPAPISPIPPPDGNGGLQPINPAPGKDPSPMPDPGGTHKILGLASLVDKQSGERNILETSLVGNSAITIGRDPTQSDYVIADRSISRSHATLTMTPQGFQILDLGSTNGTLVDGVVVGTREPYLLRHGATLSLGQKAFWFEQEGKNGSPDLPSASSWLISGFDQQGQTIQYELSIPQNANVHASFEEVCRIGRETNNDLIVRDDSISRYHAVIGFNQKNQICLMDLGSSNGTFVDGQKIGSQPYCIENSKIVQFGTTRLSITKQ